MLSYRVEQSAPISPDVEQWRGTRGTDKRLEFSDTFGRVGSRRCALGPEFLIVAHRGWDFPVEWWGGYWSRVSAC